MVISLTKKKKCLCQTKIYYIFVLLHYNFFSDEKKCEKKSSKLVETIEEGSKIVRTELTKVTDVYDSQKAIIERYYVSFMKDTQHIRNYLQEEDNR